MGSESDSTDSSIDPPWDEEDVVPVVRPRPIRGDWFQAFRWDGCCWLLKPSDDSAVCGSGPTITNWTGKYLGPVHDFDHTERFTAVLVPHPDDINRLVWVNVWTSRNLRGEKRGVEYCSFVPRGVTEGWRERGWEDRFVD